MGRATTTASSLAAEQGSGNISKTQTKATPSRPSSPITSSEGGPRCHFTMGDSPVQARPERLSNLPNEPPLGEEIDKDENVNFVKSSEQGEAHKTAEHTIESEFSTASPQKDLSLDEELAQKLYVEELAKETTRQEQEKYNLEKAFELQKQLDKRKEDMGDQAHDIDWSDPSVLRYHALQNRLFAKAEVRKNMCTYLKNRGGYKQSYFKGLSDQEEDEMKKFLKIVLDEEIAIDAIPLATKPSIIVDWKIISEGRISSYHIIRADGRSKRYTSMINLLKNIDREDLETLWKLVKAKYGDTRPKEAYERVLWGDLKVMFEPDIECKAYDKTTKEDIKCLAESLVHRRFNSRNLKIWREITSLGDDCWQLNVYILSTAKIEKEEIEIESTQSSTTAKLPLHKQGDYEMWRLCIEQYFQIQDYALWDVIENGNSFKPVAETTTDDAGTSTTIIPGLITIEEKAKKKNDVKARSMLLMALPNEHLMNFSKYKDAKVLFAAIETRFNGNEATKKTLLKQLYKNYSATSTESLDSIFNRLQKLVIQLGVLGVFHLQEDLNLNFLRSLPSEWNTHVVTGTTSTNTSSQNMAFVSSPSPNSTSEVLTVFEVSTASPQVSTANLSDATIYAFLANQPNGSQLVHEDLKKIHEDDLEEIDLKWQLALLSMRAKRFFQKTGKKITINRSDIENKTRNQETTRRIVNMEDTSSKEMVAIDGAGFDWSYMAGDEAPTNMALMDLSNSETSSVKISAYVKENISAPFIEDWESDEEDEVESPPEKDRKNVEPSVNKVEVKIPKQNDKPARRPVKYVEMYITQRPRGNQRNWNNLKSHQLGYVAFERGAKGGKITGKGTIRTGKLDFEDVY
nr:hypothetical protein [Tanacetum cinerariifolium]